MILEAPTVHFGLNPSAFNTFMAGPVGSIGLTIILSHPAARLKCSGGEGDTLYHVRLHAISFYNGEKLNTGFIEEFAPCVLGRTLLSVCRGQMVAVPPPLQHLHFGAGHVHEKPSGMSAAIETAMELFPSWRRNALPFCPRRTRRAPEPAQLRLQIAGRFVEQPEYLHVNSVGAKHWGEKKGKLWWFAQRSPQRKRLLKGFGAVWLWLLVPALNAACKYILMMIVLLILFLKKERSVS